MHRTLKIPEAFIIYERVEKCSPCKQLSTEEFVKDILWLKYFIASKPIRYYLAL